MPLDYDASRTALYHPERRDTLFQAGRDYSMVQLAVEAARLAYYRAEESSAERDRLAQALARVGFENLVLFGDSATGAAAFGARRSTDGAALLSFRGTRPDDYQDVITDLRANLVPWAESAGRVHKGFAGAFRALRPKILPWIDALQPRAHLILAGHSLGAALATLAATVWRPEWLVTIGSPRVGDAGFKATVGVLHSLRFVDCCDAVTEVPPELGGYTHIRSAAYLTHDARIVETPTGAFIMSDRLRARADYPLRYAWQFWRNVLVRDLADHAPLNYARAVF